MGGRGSASGSVSAGSAAERSLCMTLIPFTRLPTAGSGSGPGVINLEDDAENAEGDDRAAAAAGLGGRNWSWEEDRLLISGWLNISKDDATVGNDQTKDTFWRRVYRYCAANTSTSWYRDTNPMKQHWYKMNKEITLFNTCYEQVVRTCPPGSNEAKLMEMAHNLFRQKQTGDKKRKFTMELAWNILRNEAKWIALSHAGAAATSKRTKTNSSGDYTTSSNPDMPTGREDSVESLIRPQGRDAGKRKNKEKSKAKDNDPSTPMGGEASEESLIRPQGRDAGKKKNKAITKAKDVVPSIREAVETIMSTCIGIAAAVQEMKAMKEKEFEMRQKEMEMRQKEMDLQKVLLVVQLSNANTSNMSETQRLLHEKATTELLKKYSM